MRWCCGRVARARCRGGAVMRAVSMGACATCLPLCSHANQSNPPNHIKQTPSTGYNWFGFENGDSFFSGLWGGGTQLTMEFAKVLWRQQLLGFNTIRVPFGWDVRHVLMSVSRSCGVGEAKCASA